MTESMDDKKTQASNMEQAEAGVEDIARLVAAYYEKLIKEGVPDVLAQALARDQAAGTLAEL